RVINKAYTIHINEEINKGKAKNYNFMASIPHTSYYDAENIHEVSKQFDIFITGSDQVWNPNAFRPSFFLDFVADKSPKISYAASMSVTELTDDEKNVLKPLIERFDFISVREDSAKKLIEEMCYKKVKTVLDPTMLLKRQDWNEIITESQIADHYIFVYLLGRIKKQRQWIKKIAKILNLKIVNIPHVNMIYEKNDINFGDIEMKNTSPTEFIGLIKNAEMVITDSFHGCVFSTIYEKSFWALKRHKDTEKANMNSRLYTLFNNLGIENRFLEEVDSTDKVVLLKPINYEVVNKNLNKLRLDSIAFLEHALNESVKKIDVEKEKNEN
ncbi:MAG: polysaccharide pyruvyl transferase family protein, partial [Eubacterium sp.]